MSSASSPRRARCRRRSPWSTAGIKIGLSPAEREALAKIVRRDEAVARRLRLRGRRAAHRRHHRRRDDDRGGLAGIQVFATGGIGGVHKGAEKSFDISADLDELARTPVIVVSAGAKAILDIEKTLEVLETRGVPVVAYGSDVMPAFWSRSSPYPAPLRLDDAEAIAGSSCAARTRPRRRPARRQSGPGGGRDPGRGNGGLYRGGTEAASERGVRARR